MLYYNPFLGDLRWRVDRRGGYRAGSIAGHVGRDGYRTIMIDGNAFKAHRLAWLLHHGVWPKAEIDHINRGRDDNRILNLREATHSQNQVNCGMYRNNKSGYRCVHFSKATGKYVAEIKRDGKLRHLGVFSTPEIANAAVEAALGRQGV